jgi:hypothetical protein
MKRQDAKLLAVSVVRVAHRLAMAHRSHSQAIVQQTTLRRTKEMKGADGQPLVALPPLTYYHHKVKLDPEARKVYQEIEGAVRNCLDFFKRTERVSEEWGTLLALLTRLRQVACDPTRKSMTRSWRVVHRSGRAETSGFRISRSQRCGRSHQGQERAIQ